MVREVAEPFVHGIYDVSELTQICKYALLTP